MTTRHWSLAVVVAIGVGSAWAAAPDRVAPKKDLVSFGTLRGATLEAARAQALEWLKSAGKTDAATQQAFDKIWDAGQSRPILERVASTIELGNPDAANLLKEARDPMAPAPTEVPSLLKDAKAPVFFRANLALAFAKALTQRKVYEESLDALKLVKSDQVVDPAAYFFLRAVAEHGLLLKDDAARSILSVMEDVADAPNRYKDLAILMLYDMQGWRDKDLGAVARKMDNIERRLDLARGGPQTQKMQKEVVARLDEIIKELENKAKGSSQCNGGGCPNGGQGQQAGGSNQPNSPMKDSNIANNSGPGNVDQKRLKNLAENWGKLPEKEKVQAMAELTKDMPPRYRQVIENYFKDLAKTKPATP